MKAGLFAAAILAAAAARSFATCPPGMVWDPIARRCVLYPGLSKPLSSEIPPLPPKTLDLVWVQRYGSDALRKMDEGTIDGAALLLARVEGDEPGMPAEAPASRAAFITAVKNRKAFWDRRRGQGETCLAYGVSHPGSKPIDDWGQIIVQSIIETDVKADLAFAEGWNAENRTSSAESMSDLRERKRLLFRQLAAILEYRNLPSIR